MSSRETLLSALAAAALGAAAAGATPAEARTSATAVCAEIESAADPAAVRTHVGDPACGAVAIGRLMELQGLTRVAQAATPTDPPLCLYRPDDPRYVLDPRCPPLIAPSTSSGSGSGSGSDSSGPPPGYSG